MPTQVLVLPSADLFFSPSKHVEVPTKQQFQLSSLFLFSALHSKLHRSKAAPLEYGMKNHDVGQQLK